MFLFNNKYSLVGNWTWLDAHDMDVVNLWRLRRLTVDPVVKLLLKKRSNVCYA
jgi:hypothetical protein